jgi:integrase
MPPMPLRVIRRPGTASLWLSGTVRGRRIRESAGTDDPRLAEEARAAREAEIYRAAVHGTRPAVAFAAAAESYITHAGPHTPATLARLRRIVQAIGPRATLAEIDQRRIDQLAGALLRPTSGQATRLREVTTPTRAVLTHAARRGWCDMPMLEAPPPGPPRTEWLTPAEADRLITAAAPHLRPLLVFLIATGARLGEALALQWPDVDLHHARARLRDTKSGADRHLDLCPRATAALGTLPHRVGAVFRTRSRRLPHGSHRPGTAYADKPQQGGGQIKTAWASALKRANLATPARRLTPHTCRHTWATWHAAIHRDPLLLRHDGGWSSLDLVQRYAHLAPRTMAAEMVAWREARHESDTPAAEFEKPQSQAC